MSRGGFIEKVHSRLGRAHAADVYPSIGRDIVRIAERHLNALITRSLKTMTTNEKRAAIARVYLSESWQEKVAKMSDNQVIAIYQKFLADGKFDCEPVRKISRIAANIGKAIMKENNKEPAKPKYDFEQLGMDGFIFKK
jgi:hypothetical protein